MQMGRYPPKACGLGQLTWFSSFSRIETMTPMIWRPSEITGSTIPSMSHVPKYETGAREMTQSVHWPHMPNNPTSNKPLDAVGCTCRSSIAMSGWEIETGKSSASSWLWSAQHSKNSRNNERPAPARVSHYTHSQQLSSGLHTYTVTHVGSFSLPLSITYTHKIINKCIL